MTEQHSECKDEVRMCLTGTSSVFDRHGDLDIILFNSAKILKTVDLEGLRRLPKPPAPRGRRFDRVDDVKDYLLV